MAQLDPGTAEASAGTAHAAPISAPAEPFIAPHPGSQAMPRWDVGELPDPPAFSWRQWTMFLGPGLVMGASAIGGGEWLTGPMNTARYGGALLWLATLSILGQVLYNTEISRYTLYTGEPIFTGKFRTLPGPRFWLFAYLLLDFGSIFPYLASSAAIPLAAVIKGELPSPKTVPADAMLVKGLACGLFVLVLVPLTFGGKVYNSIKSLMIFKLIVVMGFLVFLALFYSTADTWWEIVSGFFRFGTLPVKGETNNEVQNVFAAWWQGRSFGVLDFSGFGMLAAMAAISGNGGLTNTPMSNYTRDQGWGMGRHVGAIPSIVGGHALQLSHVGMIFQVTKDALVRWRGWYRHVAREQLMVWMPACFLGLALPSMLSVQFLPRGKVPADAWLAAGMTAEGVANAVGHGWERVFWNLTLGVGFIVLATSMVMTADGVLRRWVDVFWTSSPRLQQWDTSAIGKLYFGVLCMFAVFGLIMLIFVNGDRLLIVSTNIYNYALGFSCLHVIAVNTFLMPRELRPNWFVRIGLVLSGCFFLVMAVITTLNSLGLLTSA